jgi:hypothetical protein
MNETSVLVLYQSSLGLNKMHRLGAASRNPGILAYVSL